MHLILYLGAIVGDCFLCWRLYMIWNHSKAILIVPVILLLGMVVNGALSVKNEFVHGVRGPNDSISIWMILGFSFTTVLNVLATGLICWQILFVSRAVADSLPGRDTSYSRFLRALIDSCGIYTLASLMFIGLKLLKQNEASIIVSDTLSVLVGLVPSLMFLRFQLQARQSRYKTSRLTVQTLATYGGTHGVDAGGGVVSTIRFAAHHDDETNTLPSLTVAALADEYEIPLDSISREIGKSVEIKRCPQSHEL